MYALEAGKCLRGIIGSHELLKNGGCQTVQKSSDQSTTEDEQILRDSCPLGDGSIVGGEIANIRRHLDCSENVRQSI
jgi:hypothetical protein